MKRYWKEIILLLLGILGCAMMARYMGGGETLSDYAKKHPQTVTGAYNGSAEAASATETGMDASTESGMDVSVADAGNDAAYTSTSPSGISASTASSSTAVAASVGATESNASADTNVSADTGVSADTKVSAEVEAFADTLVYKPGFISMPLSDEIKSRITGISYPEDDTDAQISYDDLRYLNVQYIDFDNKSRTGELICHKDIAMDLLEIFSDLYDAEYQIERIQLVDDFGGNDELSMEANNTSCFNYRVIDGTTRLSNHSLGKAIDINTFYNPYVRIRDDGSKLITPKGSEAYADRNTDFDHKISHDDLTYQLFTEHGFTWGGDWDNRKDYQHYERLK